MNPRAHHLALQLRACLNALAGAVSVSLHAQKEWEILLIMTSSDEAVPALGEHLGLSYAIRLEEGRWRHVAIGEHRDPDGGVLTCEVAGPHHWGPLPAGAERIGRMEIAPITAERVLEVARARGVVVAFSSTGERLILLASLGLDLSRTEIRGALLGLHERGALRLERLPRPSLVRAELDARGLRPELVDESVIREHDLFVHAVAIP